MRQYTHDDYMIGFEGGDAWCTFSMYRDGLGVEQWGRFRLNDGNIDALIRWLIVARYRGRPAAHDGTIRNVIGGDPQCP